MEPESVFPSYPEYRDSGVEWLGDVPSHWDINSVQRLFVLGRGRVISHEDILLNPGTFPVYSSQTEDNGVLGYLGSFDFDGGYITWTTDGANAGTVFHRNGQFNCTNVCGTLKAKERCDLDLRYCTHAIGLATPEFVRHDINPKLMNNVMAGIRFSLPPLPEQQAIADFLDCETAKIDTLIAKQERLIALLAEKRQAVISHAVTKGLNPSAAMKASGVEWLGDVPSHWEVKAIKREYNVVGGSTPKSEEPDFWDGDIQWVTPADIGKLSEPYISESQRKITLAGLQSCSSSLVPSGSLLVSTRAPIGSIAIAQCELCFNQGCKALVPRGETVCTRFCYYVFSIATQALNILGKGTTFLELSADALASFPAPFPSLPEQQAIADFLDRETDKIDALTEKAKQSIELMKERRAALISSAVTGKIDVRKVA